MKLVIIAAGEGSRLRSITSGENKTLLKLNGKTIIEQIIENASEVNIKDFVIITGYQHDAIETSIKNLNINVNIEFVYNSDWKKANGISVLLGKPFIKEGYPFMISMSDHIYGADLFSTVYNASLDGFEAIVGLDFKIEQVYDIEDAMKVTVEEDNLKRVTSMSKELSNFDAIDCGVFKCNFDFFIVLEKFKIKENFSLADGCNYLIKNGTMGGIDIKDSFWMDIDTPESFREINNINFVP